MGGDYDKYYIALGLRRGATQDEVRSAYRRMAKLYHPDHDASLDAEMRYREARRAYDALRKRPEPQPAKSPTPPPRPREEYTASGVGWYAHETDDDELYVVKERIPFSFEKIPVILWESIIEIAGVEILARVMLHVAVMNNLFGWLGYGSFFSYMVIFCSLAGFVFFRYYFYGNPAGVASNLFAKFLWSLRYILWVGFLLLMFSPNRSFVFIKSWFVVSFEMFMALFLLWVPQITARKPRK